MTEMYSWPLKCRQNTQHLKNKYKCSIKCILLPIILFYGVEVCTAFLHLCRHPGRHQNALLILAAPRHKSVSGKTDPKKCTEKTQEQLLLVECWDLAGRWQRSAADCWRCEVFKPFGPRNRGKRQKFKAKIKSVMSFSWNQMEDSVLPLQKCCWGWKGPMVADKGNCYF